MKQPPVEKKNKVRSSLKNSPSKIYIIKDDGNYNVWEYESNNQSSKEEGSCR